MVRLAGVLGKGFVTEILYSFDIDNGGISYGNLHSFETDNSKRCMSCSYIGMGLVTGMLCFLVRILEDIGHGNIIHFCYYKNNRSSDSQSNMIRISNGKVI